MNPGSGLYLGRVMHRRMRPKAHALSYRVFWLLLDLSEIDELDRRLRLFSRNRFNLLSFHESDHGDGSGAALRPRIEGWLSRAGVDIGGGAIRLLTMPRVLGFVFNPISVYYCHGVGGQLAAVAYEVTNTFGVRHSYVIPVASDGDPRGLIRQRAAKALYVSPFMGMEMDYQFEGRAPADSVELTIFGMDAEGLLITAALSGRRRPLNDRSILAAALSVPLLTLKVVAAIHWEAAKLWAKGLRLTRAPAPASEPVTVQSRPQEGRLGGKRVARASGGGPVA